MSLSQTLKNLFRRLFALGARPPLCDSCRWDYGAACSRPERPNARSCPDYKPR